MSGRRERRVRLPDGAALRVVERGGGAAGPALLLLHGFTGSAEAWGEELLRRLAAGGPPGGGGGAAGGGAGGGPAERPMADGAPVRRVIAVDLPGHGGSDVSDEPKRYRMERVLDDLEAVLDDVGVERAVWVGYSMGGRVALGGAVLRPERVEALVLESASPGLESAEDRRARRMSDEALARRIERGGPAGMEAFVDAWMELPLFATQQRLPEDVLEEARRRRLACDPRGLAGCLRGLGTGRQPSFWPRLGEVDVPVLLLTGSLDGKFEGIAGRMAEHLPRVTRRSVDGAGHTVHLEKPEAWLAAVEDFLGHP